MIMTPGLRKFALTLHVIFSVGWLGAVISFLALVITALITEDAQTVVAIWIAMESIGWFAIVPLALASLLTGLIMSMGTPWGLFQHYWVLFKFFLAIFATIILLLNMGTVSDLANISAESGSIELAGMQGELIHAGGGLLVFL
ncbi:DUF2269 domain-containing protein [Domibacillus robiginosus]|uniref:DUF2269 domain-containing protein n=1 Tax=Domibacillus robiginosus TaxID=1071054 RepID=UPI000B2DEB45|nr:DUF2269 domain-containing protein [Domibacillus robiginosus]